MGELRRWAVGVAALLAVAAGGYLLVHYLGGVLLAFLAALALSLGIDPLVGWLERRARLPRGLCALAGLVLVAGTAVALGFLVVARLAWELGDLYRALPGIWARAAEALGAVGEGLGRALASLPEPLRSALGPGGLELFGLVRAAVGAVVQGLVGSLRRLPGILALLSVALVAAYFFSRDRRVLARAFLGAVPGPWRARAADAAGRLVAVVLGMARAELLLLGLTLALTTLGLWVVGSRYALSLGVLVALLDIVPYLGPATVLGSGAAFCLAFGQPVLGLKLVALTLVLALVRQFLEVRLVGARTGLHPLVVLLSMCLAVRLTGPAGLILGPLAAALVRALVQSGLVPLPGAAPGAGRGGRA